MQQSPPPTPSNIFVLHPTSACVLSYCCEYRCSPLLERLSSRSCPCSPRATPVRPPTRRSSLNVAFSPPTKKNATNTTTTTDNNNGDEKSVREKAQDLADLLGNTDRIHAERRKAKDLRSQYGGYGASEPPRLSSGSGEDRGSSRDSYGGGGGGGGGGRSSGEVNDDWRAGYDRSPTPPPVEPRRSVGSGSEPSRSESIDFDEGRQGYSGRLSQYQEQERREASKASQPQRCVKNGYVIHGILFVPDFLAIGTQLVLTPPPPPPPSDVRFPPPVYRIVRSIYTGFLRLLVFFFSSGGSTHIQHPPRPIGTPLP